MNLYVAIREASFKLRDALNAAADNIASDVGLPNGEIKRMLYESLTKFYSGTASEIDSRTASWRARFRLYDLRKPDLPIADSDEGQSAEFRGSEVYHGLAAIAEMAAYSAETALGAPCRGMSVEALKHKLKGLRPTLSRRSGNAIWRLKFNTMDVAETVPPQYLLRVEIERI